MNSVAHSIIYESGTPGAAEATVCISLYNYGDFVAEALQSVCAQTLETIDLIVVDDQSRDHSLETAERLMREAAGRFRRALLVQHDLNAGLSAARNTAFALAETELVFVLDADNMLYPRCLSRLGEALAACDAAFAFSIIETFGSECKLMGTMGWDRKVLARGNYIDAMTMIRKSAWQSVGGYSDMKLGWEDYEFWCKLAEQGAYGVQVPEILARYRVHASSMLRTITNRPENMAIVRRRMKARHPWLFPELEMSPAAGGV